MRIEPDGCELLRVARLTLAERIAPFLPAGPRAELPAIDRAMASGHAHLASDELASHDDVRVLEDARAAVRDTLLRALPDERRYDARLVAKAIAVATQHLIDGAAGDRRELERLATLLGASVPECASAHELRSALRTLNERLAEQIRSGEMDAGTPLHEATRAHLETAARDTLALSDPHNRRLAASDSRGRPAEMDGRSPASQADGVVDGMCASWLAMIDAQASMFGYVAKTAAADPNVPMIVVETAHQLHDFSVACAELTARSFAFMRSLRRGLGAFAGSEPF